MMIVVLLLCLVACGDDSGGKPPADQVLPAVAHEWAANNHTLPLWSGYEPPEDAELRQVLEAIAPEQAEKALTHSDPKLRTLAALALGLADDTSRLHLLYPLLEDDATTFQGTTRLSVALIERDGRYVPSGPSTRTRPQIVGRVVRLLLRAWTGLHTRETTPGSVRSMERRLATWHLRLERLRLPRRDRTPLLARLEREAPGWFHAAVLLSYPSSVTRGWTHAYQRRTVRKNITRSTAREILANKPPFEDPWLQLGTLRYRAFCRRLADDLLWLPEDVPFLIEHHHFVPASRAEPDERKARAILKDAFPHYARPSERDERLKLTVALLKRAGTKELLFLKDAYFRGAAPQYNSGGFQEAFARELDGETGKRIARELLRDPRALAQISWRGLDALVRACNRLSGTEIIPKQELERLSHPVGGHGFSRGWAREEHAQATARVHATLAEWHRRLLEYATKNDW
ncbi:MAG: hypothetical protein V3T86_01670 [Planctomycetota bacterium]